MLTKQQIINAIRARKADINALGVKEIGLFGSVVREEQHQNSDIDLLIDFEPGKEKFENLMMLHDMLEATFKSNKVDIVTKNGLSKFIGPHILKEVMYV